MAKQGNVNTRGQLNTLLLHRRSVRNYSNRAVALTALHNIMAAGQGITSDDGKRTTPSPHALHPLRLYVLARRIDGLKPGFYAYAPAQKQFEDTGSNVTEGILLSASLGDDIWLEEAAAVVVVAADRHLAIQHFSEQQADGMRGLRYVDFEAGAAVQNMYLSVAAEELGAVVVMGFDDSRLKANLPLPAPIDPVALFCIGSPAD